MTKSQGRPFLVQTATGTARVVPDHIRVAVPGHVRLFAMHDILQPSSNEPALRLARNVCRRPNHPFATTLRVTEYVIPPLLAAWAPFVLFFLLGETVLIRTEE